jgi:hypothetical protein
MKSAYLVICCGLLGGTFGYLAFAWLLTQGFYGLVLPGGMLGLAAGIPRNTSRAVAVVCGVLALGLGLYTEWRFFPFKADGSFGYFLAHLHQLKPISWLMLAVGTVMGGYIPYRRVADGPTGPIDRPHAGDRSES